MAKSPFYKIITKDGTDLTELVSSFTFEDCLEEDDIVSLSITGKSFSIVDDGLFDVGKSLIHNFGFIGGLQSKPRNAQILSVDYDYDKTVVNVTVKARDLGFVLKRITSRKIFRNKTTYEIVEELGKEYGLKVEVDKSLFKKHENISIAGKTIHGFLQEIAEKEGSGINENNGPVEVIVSGDTLKVERRDFNKKSKRTYEYANGNGEIVDISISYEDNNGGASTSTSSSGIDMETGQDFTSKATSEENKEASSGERRFDINADRLLDRTPKEEEAGQTIVTPANNKQDADKKIGVAQKTAASKIMKLTMTLELDPTILAGEIITLSGVAQKHAGNWRVYKASHSVSSSASTVLECYKNGAKKSSTSTVTNSAGNVNKTQGDTESTSSERTLRIFDQNSKRLK